MTTTELPPCPLDDCKATGHHYHNKQSVNPSEPCQHSTVLWACWTEGERLSRCYGPAERPTTTDRPTVSPVQDGPIMLPEITDEMVGRFQLEAGICEDVFFPIELLTIARDILFAAIPQWKPIEPGAVIKAGMLIGVVKEIDGLRVVDSVQRAKRDFSPREYEWLGDVVYDPRTVPAEPEPDPDAELIEAMARAIWEKDRDERWFNAYADDYRRQARAALSAYRETEAGR